MSELNAQKLVYPEVEITETRVINLPSCCPISKNPLEGSKIYISYKPAEYSLEVQSLFDHIESFKGGKGSCKGNGRYDPKNCYRLSQCFRYSSFCKSTINN